MIARPSLHNTILAHAAELFHQKGIRSVSMDELANVVGVSKKTIYQHIENKAQLVEETMKYELAKDQRMCEEISSRKLNSIQEMFEIGKFISQHIRSINPILLSEIQKYYKKTWAIFAEFKFSFIKQIIYENMKRGVEEGLYRKDMNIQIICLLYLASIDVILHPQYFPKRNFSLNKVYMENLSYHVYGIATKKGIEVFENCLKNSNEE